MDPRLRVVHPEFVPDEPAVELGLLDVQLAHRRQDRRVDVALAVALDLLGAQVVDRHRRGVADVGVDERADQPHLRLDNQLDVKLGEDVAHRIDLRRLRIGHARLDVAAEKGPLLPEDEHEPHYMP